MGAVQGLQEALEVLEDLHELGLLVSRGRRSGFLERGEALRALELIERLVDRVSGGRARLTLRLVRAARALIEDPGPVVRRLAGDLLEEGRVPMPETIARRLRGFRLLPLLGEHRRLPLARWLLSKSGVNADVLELLLDFDLAEAVGELGYVAEELLSMIGVVEAVVSEYIVTRGAPNLELSGSHLSVFAEVTGRTWLAMVRGDPWLMALPAFHQARRSQYEIDAASYTHQGGVVHHYIGEVELRCHKFLESPKRGEEYTRLEGKIGRIARYIRETLEVHRRFNARDACLEALKLLCYDDPSDTLVGTITSVAEKALKEHVKTCGPPRDAVEVIDYCKMKRELGRFKTTPYQRLGMAIDYIHQKVARKHVEQAAEEC
ncbi:MAG: hypothetical protein LRS46_00190 [Desulfurococcales archaeon]|nr:hypothetical protein [Desulfurococcales archaeon]